MHEEKSKVKREFYWMLGTILLTLIVGAVIFGDNMFNGYNLELQVHDTYYIFPKSLLMTAIFVFLMISTYLNRLIYRISTNRIVNVLAIMIL